MYTLAVVLFAAFVRNSYQDPIEISHLVTMSKAELMEIVNCVSEAKNPELCEKFSQCESLMAKKVIDAYQKCLTAVPDAERRECNTEEPLFPNPDSPSQIFDCIFGEGIKLTTEERNEMEQFEVCSRNLSDEYCKTK